VPYDTWVKDGFLHATRGSMVDYEFVETRIKTLARQYRVEYLCADPWNSRMLQQRLVRAGIESLEVPQTIQGLSPGMKELERLLRAGSMTHEQNPVARWCFGNVAVHIDGNENLKPMKNKSADRIDLVVAWFNAMAVATRLEQESSVYEDRGLLIL
jgi:phage terminase large subunit-like protein